MEVVSEASAFGRRSVSAAAAMGARVDMGGPVASSAQA
jgi:hypothetical protein